VLWWRAHNRALANTAAANKAAQSVLQKKLAFDLSRGANQLIVDDTHALISGKSAGEFTFSNQLLAQYYMYAGAAYTNLKEYSQALAAYKAAPQYSSNETQAALQGQLYAGYRSGERQQLIPILQQLVTLSKQHPDPFGTSAGHYEADIQALENNQELSL
jgi:tetratricopeptide (TPR) repeat protein